MTDTSKDVLIVYDGECPFCRNYVAFTRLKESVGNVQLIDARQADKTLLKTMQELKLDLDEGMALKYNGHWYHGADCTHMLALMTSTDGLMNRISRVLFATPERAGWAYPILRFFRNLTLRLLLKKKLRNLDQNSV